MKRIIQQVDRWWGTVRGRLTILNLVCLIVILVGLILVQYLILQQFMIDQTNTLMQLEAKSSITRWMRAPIGRQREMSRLGTAIVTDLTGPESHVIVFDPNHTVIASSASVATLTPTIQIPEATTATIDTVMDGATNVNYVYGQGSSRVVVGLFPIAMNPESANSEIIGVVQFSTSFRRQDGILQELLLIDTVGMIGILMLVGLLAVPVVRAALSPLRYMARTAQMIGQGDFSQRLNLPQGSDEVGRLAVSFDHMAEQLETLFRSQRQFIGDASHELRTPLTALRGSIEVLQRDPCRNPEVTQRMLHGMHREINRLSRLVTDLLMLSQFDLGVPLRLQRFDLTRMLSDIYDQAQLLAKGQHLELATGTKQPVFYCGDIDRLREVVLNLVDNAVSHTPPGGTVSIGLDQAGNELQIYVRDTGEGIDPEALPHLFERFYRADRSRTRQRGGAGLGLAIASAIVEAHKGTITVESQAGKGSLFTVHLPLT